MGKQPAWGNNLRGETTCVGKQPARGKSRRRGCGMCRWQWQVGDMSGGGNAPVVGVAGLNKSGRSQCPHASCSVLSPTRFHSPPSPSFGGPTFLSPQPQVCSDVDVAAPLALVAQVCNLPYRGFAIRKPLTKSRVWASSRALPNAIQRHRPARTARRIQRVIVPSGMIILRHLPNRHRS